MTNKLPVVGNQYKNKITKDIYKAFKHKARENCYFMENQSQGWDLVVPLHDFFIEFEELPEDKAETKPTIKENLTLELSPEVKEAIEKLKGISLKATLSNIYYHEQYKEMRDKVDNLLNALDKQFNLPQENTNLGEEWGSFGAVLGNDKLESLENKESIITMKKSEFESLMAGAEKVDKVDTDIKKQTVDEFLSETEKEKSIWKPVSEEVDNQSIIFINKAGYARLAEVWNDKFYFIEGDAGGADVRSHMSDKTYYGKKFCTLTDFINDYEKLKERIKEIEKCLRK